MGVGGKGQAPSTLPPGKESGTRCIEGWVGFRAGLDGCGKSRLHRDSIPGPYKPIASRYTDYAGNGFNLFLCSIFPLILNDNITWDWTVSFTPRAAFPRKYSRRWQSHKRSCGPQIESRSDVCPLWAYKLICLTNIIVPMLTKLSRL